ncbi:MAG: Hpt domain-containing protein [Gemmatimonadetes bacterium]|nr:Hpt domain-containing protein [Gemmatimonadota bacterium]
MIDASRETASRGEDGEEATAFPIFDRDTMLERTMGDEGLSRMVIDVFLADIPRQIQILREFLEGGDVAGSERQAHTIKGAAANVGGEVLRELAFEMEKAARAGDLSTARAHVSELEAQFDRLKEAMITFSDSPSRRC